MPPWIKRSAVWPDPSVKPSYGAAELDWSHPLANGLVSCLPFMEGGGDRSVDLARGQSAYSVNGLDAATQYTWETVARGGPGPHIADSDGVRAAHLIRFPTSLTIPANASFTDFFFVDIIAFFSGNAGWWRTNSGGDHFHIFQNTNNRVWVRVAGTNVLQPGSGTALTTGLHCESIVNVNASSTTQYIDGAPVQSATHAVSTTAGSIDWFGSQGALTATEMMEGRYLACYFWLRALSDSEVGWLHAEPFAMFRPIVRRRYVVPTAAGRIFKLAGLGGGLAGPSRGMAA